MENQIPIFRVIIAGSREFIDYEYLKKKMDIILSKRTEKIIIVSGTASGADKLGEQYAKEKGFDIAYYPADWNRYKRSAGYIRNVEMAMNADACVVFRVNNSSGSTHMINIAKEKNLLLRYFDF